MGSTILDTAPSPASRGPRTWLRRALALFYLVGGIFHFARPLPFIAITPGWVPWPHAVVLATGLAELLAVPALLQPWSPRLRRAAGIGLAIYAVCVFPANINHMLIDMAKPDPVLGWAYHVPRMFAQPVLVWLALWVSGTIDWPLRRSGRA